MECKAIVIGASAGALQALSEILAALPGDFAIPVMIVTHLPPDKRSIMAELLDGKTPLVVKEAEDKEEIMPGHVYVAPPDYHLQMEQNGFLSLSGDEPVRFSRPSIDVLFETAADAYGSSLAGVVLTGANADGSAGLAAISRAGGLCLVQRAETAFAPAMPEAALAACPAAEALELGEIAARLIALG